MIFCFLCIPCPLFRECKWSSMPPSLVLASPFHVPHCRVKGSLMSWYVSDCFFCSGQRGCVEFFCLPLLFQRLPNTHTHPWRDLLWFSPKKETLVFSPSPHGRLHFIGRSWACAPLSRLISSNHMIMMLIKMLSTGALMTLMSGTVLLHFSPVLCSLYSSCVVCWQWLNCLSNPCTCFTAKRKMYVSSYLYFT